MKNKGSPKRAQSIIERIDCGNSLIQAIGGAKGLRDYGS